MQPIPLTQLTQGINRLRVKGGANPQSLYDLVNAYITNEGTIQQREGTANVATLDSTSRGLFSFKDVLNVCATSLISVPSGFAVNVLINPANPSETLETIWFAQPFMGFPYIVAEFSDGSVYHYWLQSSGTWAANTVYTTGTIVTPDVANGLAYIAQRQAPPNPVWTPETGVTLNMKVEPTQYTGYYYKAVAVAGTSPHTGSTEPVWPVTKGATIQEFGDFDTTNTDSGTNTAAVDPNAPLSTNITDRYGDSEDVAGQTGTPDFTTSSVAASTVVTTWAAGTIYAPGAVVQPSTGQGAVVNAIPNGDFEAGNDGNWVLGTGWSIGTSLPYQGSEAAEFAHTGAGNFEIRMNTFGVVTVGQSVTATCYAEGDSDGVIFMNLKWYDASDTHISDTVGTAQAGGGGPGTGSYTLIGVTGSAPAGAAHCRVALEFSTGSGSARSGRADLVIWNLETPAAVSNFLFEAVQAGPATSASTEPSWPTTAGNTVVDGGVTWKAIGTSIVTWQAIPIMLSGSSEPSFPTSVGSSVGDPSTYADLNGVAENTSMSWTMTTRVITDVNNPQTTPVCLGASHVFAGDKDIVAYSAAVDPTDWTSANNAGYLPTGLNNYGATPVTAIGLYRSNLVVFNDSGYQMWQIDPDPANMALLDAEPVSCPYTRSLQSVANDLLLLTEVGVRNLGLTGATANLQMGNTGQPIDPIVIAQIQEDSYVPISLYYPGRGQYWLIFGPQAFVLTINGQGVRTWSRYIFPAAITDWTIQDGALYLRTLTDLVWRLDATVEGVDDSGASSVDFVGIVQTPYLDMQGLGINKMLIGIDLVGTGAVTIQLGFNQNDLTTFNDNAGFSTSANVTPPYDLAVDDTVPGEPIPFPINSPSLTMILTFPGSQSWSLNAANFYVNGETGGGATGP